MAKYRLYCLQCTQEFYTDKKEFPHACSGPAKLSPNPDVWKCKKGHELLTDRTLKSVGYYCQECREEGKPFENMIKGE